MVSMNRRQFLSASAASLAATSAGRFAVGASSRTEPWYAGMLRWGHLNLNERDPLTLDADEWMDYFASLKVQAVLHNGGGIMAFYPTAVPFHRRSAFLGSRDLLGDLVTASRRRGIRIVARMDPNYAYEDAWKAHPEWFEANEDGSPRRHPECDWLYKTCMFSAYFTEQMPAVYREIGRRYSPDCFYTNGWPGTQALEVCYCANCQKIYREQTGGVPPRFTDAHSAIYRKYYEVYMDRIAYLWKLWEDGAKRENPESGYVGNLGGGIRTVKNVNRMGSLTDWFYADYQGRSGDSPIWLCAQQGRIARAVAEDRTAVNAIGAYDTGNPGWRHASKTREEVTLWMAQAAASGVAPCYHWLGGQPEDNRWRESGRTFFSWLALNEVHFQNRRSVANLAVLYPQRTISFYAANGKRERSLNSETIDSADYLQGLYASLLAGRFLFDFVHEDHLNAAALKRYRALLIPNAAYLRDSACDAIREYVAQGGSLLATFETSRYNEWGDLREDFGLKDVFGVSAAGSVIGPAGNSYMRIESAHPVLAGYEGTSILPGPEFRTPVRGLADAPLHLSVVPAYPAFPPEMVYPRETRTHEPAGVFRELGRSRIVYFPGDVDRTFWRSGHPDFSQLLSNSIHWLLQEQPLPVKVEGRGELELFAWETDSGFALHVLNYTNPRMTHPYINRFYPVGPLQVQFQVPDGRKIDSVQGLRGQGSLSFKQSGESVIFDLPQVVDYEVIVLS